MSLLVSTQRAEARAMRRRGLTPVPGRLPSVPSLPFAAAAPASRSATSSWTSQAAISSSLAPSKHSSQTPTASPPQRTGGPKMRHVTGRAAYRSHVPVSGSSTGQGSSSGKFSSHDSNSASPANPSWRVQPVRGIPGALPHARGARRIAWSPTPADRPQAGGVQLGNRERSQAALAAARPAYQPGSALLCRLRQRRVYDLDKLPVPMHCSFCCSTLNST
jgi:hypothetical protein